MIHTLHITSVALACLIALARGRMEIGTSLLGLLAADVSAGLAPGWPWQPVLYALAAAGSAALVLGAGVLSGGRWAWAALAMALGAVGFALGLGWAVLQFGFPASRLEACGVGYALAFAFCAGAGLGGAYYRRALVDWWIVLPVIAGLIGNAVAAVFWAFGGSMLGGVVVDIAVLAVVSWRLARRAG